MTKSPLAKKSLGQNFLVDEAIIQSIVSVISPREHDTLVEIGPGLGAITQFLASDCKHLHLIEFDQRMVAELAQKFASYSHISIHAQNVLSFDWASLQDLSPLRIVGNLPYNISTAILLRLCLLTEWLQDGHFMVQKEVAQRVCAGPGSKQYGRLSVVLGYHFDCSVLFDVPPTAFEPRPKVHSSIIALYPKSSKTQLENPDLFEALVKMSFSMRRKTLGNNLKRTITSEQLNTWGVDPKQRAEQIDIETFVRLSNLAHQAGISLSS